MAVTDLLRVKYKVPVYSNQININDRVKWLVQPKKKGKVNFEAMGVVTEIYTVAFGGRVHKSAAKIKVLGNYLKVYPKRKFTTVGLEKLKKVQ